MPKKTPSKAQDNERTDIKRYVQRRLVKIPKDEDYTVEQRIGAKFEMQHLLEYLRTQAKRMKQKKGGAK